MNLSALHFLLSFVSFFPCYKSFCLPNTLSISILQQLDNGMDAPLSAKMDLVKRKLKFAEMIGLTLTLVSHRSLT